MNTFHILSDIKKNVLIIKIFFLQISTIYNIIKNIEKNT